MSGVCALPETWLGYVKPFSGEHVLFWMKQAGKRPVGLKWILYLKQLTKHSSSYHFVSLPCSSQDPFSRLQLVLPSTPAPLRVHQRVAATRASRLLKAHGQENKETLVAAPATESLGPLSQPQHQEGPSIFRLPRLMGNNSSRYKWEILWGFNSPNRNKELSDSPVKKGNALYLSKTTLHPNLHEFIWTVLTIFYWIQAK